MKTRKIDFKFQADKKPNELKIGDVFRSASGKTVKVTGMIVLEGVKVFKTDIFGLVYENEILGG